MLKVSGISLLSCFVVASVTLGQQPTPMNGLRLTMTKEIPDGLAPGPYSLSVLIKNPAIVKELDLNDEQTAKLRDAEKQYEENRDSQTKELTKKKRTALDAENKEEFIKSNEELRSANERLGAEFEDILLLKVLDRRQGTRLKEIRLQAEGPTAFTRPEVRESLGLDAEQIEAIQRIKLNAVKEIHEAGTLSPDVKFPRSSNDDSAEAKTFARAVEKAKVKMSSLRVSSMKSIEQILTKAQRAKYQNMVGEPFTFFKLKKELLEDQPGTDQPKKDPAPPKSVK